MNKLNPKNVEDVYNELSKLKIKKLELERNIEKQIKKTRNMIENAPKTGTRKEWKTELTKTINEMTNEQTKFNDKVISFLEVVVDKYGGVVEKYNDLVEKY